LAAAAEETTMDGSFSAYAVSAARSLASITYSGFSLSEP
jgi:hypothetical protein